MSIAEKPQTKQYAPRPAAHPGSDHNYGADIAMVSGALGAATALVGAAIGSLPVVVAAAMLLGGGAFLKAANNRSN